MNVSRRGLLLTGLSAILALCAVGTGCRTTPTKPDAQAQLPMGDWAPSSTGATLPTGSTRQRESRQHQPGWHASCLVQLAARRAEAAAETGHAGACGTGPRGQQPRRRSAASHVGPRHPRGHTTGRHGRARYSPCRGPGGCRRHGPRLPRGWRQLLPRQRTQPMTRPNRKSKC